MPTAKYTPGKLLSHLENPDTNTIIELDRQYYLNCFGARTPLVLVEGKGCTVTDADGRTYLDLLGGIAVNLLGYKNPKLTAAIAAQAEKLIHISNLYYSPQQALLAQELCRRSEMEKAFFSNSGAEANEAAIKLARGYFHQHDPRRTVIYTATNSFHGRTLATVTATGQAKYSRPFAPLPPDFKHLPFNDQAALKEACEQPDTAAIMLELIQGESGVHPVDHSYAKFAETCCRENGVLLIVDEIQTGMGRTGLFTASDYFYIKPDMITLAKGLGGGVPIGATLARGPVVHGFTPGSHGTTFGGNPLACTAALAVLEEYDRLQLDRKAAFAGVYLKGLLESLAAAYPAVIAEVRGLGMMIGLDFCQPIAPTIRQQLMEAGFLVNACSDYTLRLLPPIIISKTEMKAFCHGLTNLVDRYNKSTED